jgi:hypothetical protein
VTTTEQDVLTERPMSTTGQAWAAKDEDLAELITRMRKLGIEPANVAPVSTADPKAEKKAVWAHRLHTWAYIGAAAGATVWAYLRMVNTGIDGGLTEQVAYGAAGFLELALVGSALGARRAVLRSEPTGVYTALTWLFSLLSGIFSGMHDLGREGVPWYMPLLGMVAPLVAATLWHVLLTGDRHMTAGISLEDLRDRRRQKAARRRAEKVAERKERDGERLMLAYIVAKEDERNARRVAEDPNEPVNAREKARRSILQLREKARTARNNVLMVMPVEEFDERYASWRKRLEHADENDAALFVLGLPPAVTPPEPPAPVDPLEQVLASVPDPETTLRIAEILQENPKTNQADIALEVGASRQTVSRRVGALREAGVLPPSPSAGTNTPARGITTVAAVS